MAEREWKIVLTGSTQDFGAGEGIRAVGKDLTLIGLSNRHVRLALSQRGYEVGFFSWWVGESVFQSKKLLHESMASPPWGRRERGLS